MMQNVQDLQDKIFFEVKNILENLSKINSNEELLARQDLFSEVTDRLAFLRILDKNRESLTFQSITERADLQDLNTETDSAAALVEEAESTSEEIIEEEVLYTTEINEIEPEEVAPDALNFEIEPTAASPNEVEVAAASRDEKPEVSENEEIDHSVNTELISEKERTFLELEERRRKIVEFTREQPTQTAPEPATTVESKAATAEKKFKLANIKGLKAMQNLFDDDPLEHNLPHDEPSNSAQTTSGILKNNIPTDYMEAPRKRPEFKIDINDKIAFTKLLFGGNEDELKKTVEKLNTFEHLEQAREYLSELYYQKDWQKVDEYAQRLWNLVEEKLM